MHRRTALQTACRRTALQARSLPDCIASAPAVGLRCTPNRAAPSKLHAAAQDDELLRTTRITHPRGSKEPIATAGRDAARRRLGGGGRWDPRCLWSVAAMMAWIQRRWCGSDRRRGAQKLEKQDTTRGALTSASPICWEREKELTGEGEEARPAATDALDADLDRARTEGTGRIRARRPWRRLKGRRRCGGAPPARVSWGGALR